MLQAGGDLDFAQKPVRADGGPDFRMEHLDGHLAPVLHVPGEKNGGHAATPELSLKGVAVGERRCQRVEEFAQDDQQAEMYKDTVGGPLSEAAPEPY